MVNCESLTKIGQLCKRASIFCQMVWSKPFRLWTVFSMQWLQQWVQQCYSRNRDSSWNRMFFRVPILAGRQGPQNAVKANSFPPGGTVMWRRRPLRQTNIHIRWVPSCRPKKKPISTHWLQTAVLSNAKGPLTPKRNCEKRPRLPSFPPLLRREKMLLALPSEKEFALIQARAPISRIPRGKKNLLISFSSAAYLLPVWRCSRCSPRCNPGRFGNPFSSSFFTSLSRQNKRSYLSLSRSLFPPSPLFLQSESTNPLFSSQGGFFPSWSQEIPTLPSPPLPPHAH